MTVYVDDMKAPYRRMKMCHLIADHEAELLAMVDRIGVARRWRQGTPGLDDHFDIALVKRSAAVAAGAVEVSYRTLGLMVAVRKRTGKLPLPELAEPEFRRIWRERERQILGHNVEAGFP